MIEISHLTKKFDQFVAIDDLSFSIREGEVLGFLGPNGAGKSTTMKVLTGFLSPSSGTVAIHGHDISTAALEAKRLIGYLPEGAPSYGDMTTLEFLRFIAQVRGFRGVEVEQKVDQAINEVALHTVRDQSIETLSKGFKRRWVLRRRSCMTRRCSSSMSLQTGWTPIRNITCERLSRTWQPIKL